MWCAIWRCCCGPPCWTISGWCPPSTGRPARLRKRTGLNVRVAAGEASDDLPDEHKTCIYRLVQEALNNAARHASARNVRVDGRQ